jgi:hypothetical protein
MAVPEITLFNSVKPFEEVSHCVVITDRCPSVLTFCSAMSSMNLNTANISGSTFNSIGGHQINISLTNCVAGVTQSCFCCVIQLIHTPLDNYRLISPANAGIDLIGQVAL